MPTRAGARHGSASCCRPSAASSLLALGLGARATSSPTSIASRPGSAGWRSASPSLALVAFLAVVGRELAGIWRERKIEHLREAAIDALAVKDHEAAKRVVRRVSPPSTASASPPPSRAAGACGLSRRDHRRRRPPRHRRARAPRAARRAGEARHRGRGQAGLARHGGEPARHRRRRLRGLRGGAAPAATLARIYGGRPGLFGFLRLARAAFNHLAVTGGVAVGDSLMQQVLGLGLAARISAKLGEGVLNGLMTARFGLAALAVCRPLPFVREEPPKIGDVAGELLSRAEAVTG